MSTFAKGPFSPEVNSMLGESFGQSLDHLDVHWGQDESTSALNAKAYTIGNTIAFGSGIHDSASDPDSMEVIAHEVSHALAGSTGQDFMDTGRDDAGEVGAYDAGDTFRDYVAGGASGPAPSLAPAAGGTAMIHRSEAGEHVDAIEGAEQIMDDAGETLDPEVAKTMKRKITLANGVEVSPGQITAMMGDFYGAYTVGDDGKQHFDPMKSFELMNNAPPEEMAKIQAALDAEHKSVVSARENGTEFEHTENAELEDLTSDRRLKTENGTTTGLSFMDLAQKNANHFNTEDESGTDNNLGAYKAFHGQALETAQKVANMPPGEERDKLEQRALALEASSQHFLTDRFAGGHQFDKQQMVDDNGGGKIANLRARVIHDELNVNGTMVKDHDGNEWLAKGDGHWADEDNEDNRVHSVKASASSYGDFNAVLSGDQNADDFAADNRARELAPKWNEELNDKEQERAKDLGVPGMLWDNLHEIGLLPSMGKTLLKQRLLHPVQDNPGILGTGDPRIYGEAWKRAKEYGGELLDSGGELLDDGGELLDDGLDYGGELLDKGLDAGGELVDDGLEAAGDLKDGAIDYAAEKKKQLLSLFD